jgi:hypothetical protein
MFSAYAQQLSLRFLLQADAADRPSAAGALVGRGHVKLAVLFVQIPQLGPVECA